MSRSSRTKMAMTSVSSSPDYSQWDQETTENALGFEMADVESTALALIGPMAATSSPKFTMAVGLAVATLALKLRAEEIPDVESFSSILAHAMGQYSWPFAEMTQGLFAKGTRH